MGAEFLAKKALLYMCYKICARTSNFYVCGTSSHVVFILLFFFLQNKLS